MTNIAQKVTGLRTDIGKIADSDNNRISQCLLTVAASPLSSFIVATDAKTLAIVRVDCEPSSPDEMAIPASIAKGNQALPPLIVRNGEWRREDEVRKRGQYAEVKATVAQALPDEDLFFPQVEAIIDNVAGHTHTVLRIDAKRLLELAKVLAEDGKTITLIIPETTKKLDANGVIISDTREHGKALYAIGELGFGAIMPMSLNGGNDNGEGTFRRFNQQADEYKQARAALGNLRGDRKKAAQERERGSK